MTPEDRAEKTCDAIQRSRHYGERLPIITSAIHAAEERVRRETLEQCLAIADSFLWINGQSNPIAKAIRSLSVQTKG